MKCEFARASLQFKRKRFKLQLTAYRVLLLDIQLRTEYNSHNFEQNSSPCKRSLNNHQTTTTLIK